MAAYEHTLRFGLPMSRAYPNLDILAGRRYWKDVIKHRRYTRNGSMVTLEEGRFNVALFMSTQMQNQQAWCNIPHLDPQIPACRFCTPKGIHLSFPPMQAREQANEL